MVAARTDWPRASPKAIVAGRIRERPEDFVVSEQLGIELEGSGEHLYLHVQKRDITTNQVQKHLARYYSVKTNDVAYAGLKDKNAVASQWFSVHTAAECDSPTHDAFRVVESTRHRKKLRHEHVLRNDFAVTVRDAVGDTDQLKRCFTERPYPNYFGEQRFGAKGRNVVDAMRWVENGRKRVPRFQRGIYLSSLRSYLFNEVLAERVRNGTWDTPVEGDVLLDGVPTGPLWGRGRSTVTAIAEEVELSVIARDADVGEALEWVGLSQARRPLYACPEEAVVTADNGDVRLQFTLQPGTYATSALQEWIDLR